MQHYLRSRRVSSGPIHAVVDLMILVDNSLYREYLHRYDNSPQMALREIRRYYTLVVALVSGSVL